MLPVAVLFAPACLVLLLWLSRIEESLPSAIERAQRAPAPAPIVSIPVQRTSEPQRDAAARAAAQARGLPATDPTSQRARA